MKFLSLIVLSGFLTVSCAHKKSCCSKDHCDKSEKKACCMDKDKKVDCKDGHCKKEEVKAEEKKQ